MILNKVRPTPSIAAFFFAAWALVLISCQQGQVGVEEKSVTVLNAPEEPILLGPELGSKPTRVVSLSPSITETVIALGLQNFLVGVTRFCNAPNLEGIAKVGGYVDPSVEAIIALHPDLVIAEPSPGNRESVLQISNLGISVLVIPNGGIADIRQSISVLADFLERPAAGLRLLEQIDNALDEVREASRDLPTKRVAIIFGRNPLILAGPGSFGDELIQLAGGVNIASDAKTTYPNYPLELFVAKMPEVVIETSMTTDQRPTPLDITSSYRHVVVEGDALLRPGPGLIEAARIVLNAFYPELVKDNVLD